MTRREGRLQMPRPAAVRRNPQVEAVALVESSIDLNTAFKEILCARMGKNRHAVAGSDGGDRVDVVGVVMRQHDGLKDGAYAHPGVQHVEEALLLRQLVGAGVEQVELL